MKRKVLITGITGFAGSHLVKYLVSRNEYEISGTFVSEESIKNIADIKDSLTLSQVNLLDSTKVVDFVKKTKPDLVFHLAALSSPADSFGDPVNTVTNNIVGQINLLEAIQKGNLGTTARILVTSSADVYGLVEKSDLPIDEETPFKPANPYAVSKIAQDYLALQYFLSYKLPIIRVRPFNHIGPFQSPHFVVASIAKRIAEIEKRKKEPVLLVGNLTSKRDFTDVRDMVYAYTLVIEKGHPGDVYNIGSGVSYKIADILEKLLSFATIKIEIKEDSDLLRPSDTPDLVCDSSKFRKLTGWKPTISIDQTVKDTLDYWRDIV